MYRDILREKKEKMNWTTEELSNRSGVPIGTITKIEIPLVCPHCGREIPVDTSEEDLENDLELEEEPIDA